MEQFSIQKNENLNVLFVERPSNPKLVYLQLMIGIGSDREIDKNLEIGHFLEHLFASLTSSKYPDSQSNRQFFAKHNIIYDATTESKTTTFEYALLKSKLNLFLDMFIRAVIDFQVDLNIFKNERESIIEELNDIIEDSTYLLTTETDNTLFKNYPRGTPDHIRLKNTKRMTPSEINDYWKANYVSNTSILGVFGKINKKEFMKQMVSIRKKHIEEYKITPKKGKTQSLLSYYPITTRNLTYPLIYLKSNDTSQIKFSINLNFDLFDMDYYTIFALDFVLTNDLDSILYKKLRTEKGLIYNIESYFEVDELQPELSFFYIETSVSPNKIMLVMHEIIAIFSILTKKYLKKYHLQRFRETQQHLTLLRKEEMDYKDTLNNYLKFILFNKSKNAKLLTQNKENKLLLQVNEADILKLSQKIFRKNNICISYTNNKNVNKEITKLLQLYKL